MREGGGEPAETGRVSHVSVNESSRADGTHLDSAGLTWTLLDSAGLTWTPWDLPGPTWTGECVTFVTFKVEPFHTAGGFCQQKGSQ